MPNWRAIRTLTPWALAGDPPQRQTSAASNNARRRARRKLGPVKASSRPACFSFPGGPVPAGDVLHHLRSAPPSTSRDRRGWSVPHCDPRCWRGMALCLHPPSTLRLLHSHMIVGRMAATPLPHREHLTICFAHVAYRLGERFALRNTGIRCFELRTLRELEARIGAADVLVVSGLWRNELLDRAKSLRFIQSISAGTDQYAREALRARGIRLASAQGANEGAVAEHAMALMLALARQLPQARDNQARRHWRAMISDPALREDELAGKTLLIVGLGRIGSRLAALASGFGMRVIATKRNPAVAT